MRITIITSSWFIGLLLLLGLPTKIVAQPESPPVGKSLDISLQAVHQSILPQIGFIKYAYHPALRVGLVKTIKDRPRHQLELGAYVGGYYQKRLKLGIHAQAQFNYVYRLGQRWHLGAGLALGPQLAFYPGTVYGFDNDQWSAENNRGELKILASIPLQIGFRLNETDTSPALSVQFLPSLELPINIVSGFPQFWAISLRTFPFQNR